jgi:outer membrane murein-binding lipoprotein Lpp
MPLAMFALAMALLSGCSERQHASEAAGQSAAQQPSPAIAAEPADEPSEPGSIIKGTAAPGGVAATFEARLKDGQVHKIAETRTPAGAGEYSFYGARLVEYHGSALQSDANIELKFNMSGVVTAATSSAGKVSDDEINAIRTRAQVLRSAAAARQATQGHGG